MKLTKKQWIYIGLGLLALTAIILATIFLSDFISMFSQQVAWLREQGIHKDTINEAIVIVVKLSFCLSFELLLGGGVLYFLTNGFIKEQKRKKVNKLPEQI